MIHYSDPKKDGSTYDFVMVENGLQADNFMQAKKIDEAWLYRAGGKLYLAWRTG